MAEELVPPVSLSRSDLRPTVLPGSLAALDGPTEGIVELPLHLDWSSANRYDLAVPRRLETLYRTVLIEARSPADLSYLDGATLKTLWLELRLPHWIRRDWEQAFPELIER